jgi:hypothetical protein
MDNIKLISYIDWFNKILYSEKILKTFKHIVPAKQKTHYVPITINNQLSLIKDGACS